MRPVLILYSSSEGQVRKVVARVIEYLTVRGKEARIDDVGNPIESMDAAGYRAVVLAASVHLGQHASEMISFVRKHRNELGRLPTAFLAVSLAAASAEDEKLDPSQHARSSAEVAKATRDFLERTGLTPRRVLPVAGAVLYTRQGRFARFVMQPIAHDSGVDPDSDRDFEHTAWNRLDRFIDEFLSLRPPIPVRKAVPAHG
jgi:menaquinone-dependent protoporphyrinogen oxidase